MEKIKEYNCQKCKKNIPEMNRIIHDIRCTEEPPEEEENIPFVPRRSTGSTYPIIQNKYKKEEFSRKDDDAPFIPRKSTNSNYPGVLDKYKKETIAPRIENTRKNDIMCPKCSMTVKMSELESHSQQCEYSACRFCFEYYPNFILNQHIANCPRSSSQAQQDNNSMMIQEDDDLPNMTQGGPTLLRTDSQANSSFFEPQNENEISNRSIRRTFIPMRIDPRVIRYETITRTPDGFVYRVTSSPIDRSPFSQRGILNLDGESNQNDFQQFTNHSNFIRLNRYLFNPQFIRDLLEQLHNPNRGVPKEEINKLTKKTFKKKDTPQGEEEQCTICITEFEDGEEIRELPCKHIFHPNCIDTWIVQNSHCPICKDDVNERIN